MKYLLAILAGCLSTQAANVLVSGNSMGEELPAALQNGLPQHSFTFVPAEQFATIDKSSFQAIWLDGFSDFPNFSLSGVHDFVGAGGTLLVEGPGYGSQSIVAYPLGVELERVYSGDSGGEDAVRVFATDHPLMRGLTDSGLSWTGSTPPAIGTFSQIWSFTGVADTGSSGFWVTVTRDYGDGTLVYTDQTFSRQLREFPDDLQALQFIDNVVTVPEPAISFLVLAGLGAFILARRRSR